MTAMTGSYASDDQQTRIDWAVPEWTAAERLLCATGMHIATRKRVVVGWIGYFTSVDHYYCACGRRRWIKYNRVFVECETVEPGDHLRWIASHVEMTSLWPVSK